MKHPVSPDVGSHTSQPLHQNIGMKENKNTKKILKENKNRKKHKCERGQGNR